MLIELVSDSYYYHYLAFSFFSLIKDKMFKFSCLDTYAYGESSYIEFEKIEFVHRMFENAHFSQKIACY